MGGAPGRAGRRRQRIAPPSNAPSAKADWLRHAVDELGKLAPQPGEETALADRRAIMMQSEKVAEDLRDAHDVIAGSKSAVPALAGVIRRLERRNAQAPSLVGPAVKALDAALNALEETRGASRTGAARGRFRPGRTRTQRGAAFRAARGGPQILRPGGRSGGAGGEVQ